MQKRVQISGPLAGEPVRYPYFYGGNNGYRRHVLALGKRRADAINAARAGDINAALDAAMDFLHADQPQAFHTAAALIAAARKLPGDIPAYRIRRDDAVMVDIPYMFVRQYRPRIEVSICWHPMWGMSRKPRHSIATV